MEKYDWELALLLADKSIVSSTKLMCDGYEIQLSNTYISDKRKVVLACYVNGSINGAWTHKNNEIGAKFWQPFTIKPVKDILDMYYARGDVKSAREYRQKCAQVLHWIPYYPNAQAVIKKLKSTCVDIKLL